MEKENSMLWINASKKTKLTYILMFAFLVTLSNYFMFSIEFDVIKWVAFVINNALYVLLFTYAYQRIKALNHNK